MSTLLKPVIGAARVIDPPLAEATDAVLTTRARAMLAELRATGRRAASLATAGEALVAYWTFVREASQAERLSVLQALSQAIAAGGVASRAWLPIALGDPQFEFAHAAARGYLGGWPASLERREQGVADVNDWIVRSLALNRAALLFALLEQADADGLERLGALRGRLTQVEAQAVIEACVRVGHEPLVEFATQWRALLDAPVSSRPLPPPRAA